MKIYRSNLINDILLCSSFEEVKARINENMERLQSLPISGKELNQHITITLAELKDLNRSVLGCDQYANIIAAKVHLKELYNTSLNAAS